MLLKSGRSQTEGLQLACGLLLYSTSWMKDKGACASVLGFVKVKTSWETQTERKFMASELSGHGYLSHCFWAHGKMEQHCVVAYLVKQSSSPHDRKESEIQREEQGEHGWVHADHSIAHVIFHCSRTLASDHLHSQPHPTAVLTVQRTQLPFPVEVLHARFIYYRINKPSNPPNSQPLFLSRPHLLTQ